MRGAISDSGWSSSIAIRNGAPNVVTGPAGRARSSSSPPAAAAVAGSSAKWHTCSRVRPGGSSPAWSAGTASARSAQYVSLTPSTGSLGSHTCGEGVWVCGGEG
eukprot:365152-Chlamydomonas_euryale.AAC.15